MNKDFVKCFLKTSASFCKRAKKFYEDNQKRLQNCEYLTAADKPENEMYNLYGVIVTYRYDDVFTGVYGGEVKGLALTADFEIGYQPITLYLNSEDSYEDVKMKFERALAHNISQANVFVVAATDMLKESESINN